MLVSLELNDANILNKTGIFGLLELHWNALLPLPSATWKLMLPLPKMLSQLGFIVAICRKREDFRQSMIDAQLSYANCF
jgi:hypothetical protein